MKLDLRVFIIEDNSDMAQYLKTIIEDQGFVAYIFDHGAAALNQMDALHPELVLLDIELPDIDGRSICQQIKQFYPETKIIMVTGHSDPADISGGLNLGADDYIGKPVDAGELVARIKARFRQSTQDTPVLNIDDLSINQLTHEVKRGDKTIALTPQEFRLLRYLLLNPNRVLTREMILSHIWDGNPDIETRVVDVYIGYLRKKIDFKEPKLIHSVRGFGYMLKSSEAESTK